MWYEIPIGSIIKDELFSTAINTNQWSKYYNFHVTPVPFDLAFRDPFLYDLGMRHKLAVGIIRLDPFVCYDWHKDSRRGVCINMLLNDVESKCLFADSKDEATHKFSELQYKVGKYYVFNNQVEHMVINFAQSRYLMSVEFEEDKYALTYDGLLRELEHGNHLVV
jgi:hypothetical protein